MIVLVCGHKEAKNELSIPAIGVTVVDGSKRTQLDITRYVCCDACRAFGPEKYPHSCRKGKCNGHPAWLNEAKPIMVKRGSR